MHRLGTVVLVAFGLVLLIGTMVFLLNYDRSGDIARIMTFLEWSSRLLGIFIAATAALILLLAGVGTTLSVERIPIIVLALLGGLMLIASHWALALATGAIVVVALWRGYTPRLPPPGADLGE